MPGDSEKSRETHSAATESEKKSGAGSDLQMAPELMLDLARQAAEILVERIKSLPGDDAWEGDFRQGLEEQLLEDPPEDGRPAAAVLEQAARDVLPIAVKHDHPRFFGFIPSSPTWPSVLADFLAAGYNINTVTWLVASGPSQLELVVIDWFRRWLDYPQSAGGLFTSGGSAACLDALVAAREAAGHPERATVYMSDQSHSVLSRAAMIIGVPSHREELNNALAIDEDFTLTGPSSVLPSSGVAFRPPGTALADGGRSKACTEK